MGRGMEPQKRSDTVVEMKSLLLDTVELEAKFPHWNFHGTFGSADVEFRREVKSEDSYLGITVKAIKIERYHQGRSCKENEPRTETKVKTDVSNRNENHGSLVSLKRKQLCFKQEMTNFFRYYGEVRYIRLE